MCPRLDAVFVTVLALFAGPLRAHDRLPGVVEKTPVALVGGTVFPVDAAPIERGVVVFAVGRIVTVGGAETPVPAEARRIDATGKRLYPGLIACNTQLGLIEIESIRATRDHTEVGELNPNLRAEIGVNPDSEMLPVTQAAGIAIAEVAPNGGLVAGQSAVIRLDGFTVEHLVIGTETAMHLYWPSMETDDGEGRPNPSRKESRDRSLQLLSDLLARSRAWAALPKPSDPTIAAPDLKLEAMRQFVSGERPFFVHADAAADIRAAVEWAAAEKLRIAIVGGRESPRVAALLREQAVPVVYGPLYQLPAGRARPLDEIYSGPARLHEAGVRFSVVTPENMTTRNLGAEAGTATAFGLPREIALRSITLSAAEILGIEDRYGSLRAGKSATLVVADGDILEASTRVEMMWVDGRAVDLENRQTALYRKYLERLRREAAPREF